MIHIAIDATNISSGGGLTHLRQLLYAASPADSDIGMVTIWTNSRTASQLPKRHWLECRTPHWCDSNSLKRLWGQQQLLVQEANVAGCEVLFSPGGTLPWGSNLPMVTMSRNMLPFESDRAALFRFLSWMRIKMALLRIIQENSFRRANGVIFLTRYAQKAVNAAMGGISAEVEQIAHGVDARFIMKPRHLMEKENYRVQNKTFRLLYVSSQMPYKHQLEVIEAVTTLRRQGCPISLQLVGACMGSYGQSVAKRVRELDPKELYLRNTGDVPFEKLHEFYRDAEAFIFASSCENMPNILIEAMAAGLTIICSNRGPMPEILGEAGEYFNPEDPASIASAIEAVLNNPERGKQLAKASANKAKSYSWDVCAKKTFDFVAKIAREN